MAAIINFAFDDDEDFVFPFQGTDRDGNANAYSGNWILLARTAPGAGVSLYLAYYSPNAAPTVGTPAYIQTGTMQTNQPISFVGAGPAPAGLTLGATYFAKANVPGSGWTFSATAGGAAINTSGTEGSMAVIAGIDGSDQANGNVVVTFPNGLLPVGTYVYDLANLSGGLVRKIIKGTVTVTKGVFQ